MKKYILINFLVLSNMLFSQSTVTKKLGDFYKIKVYNGINIELIRSQEHKIQVTGEKSQKIKIKNTNGILKISLKFPDLLADGKANVKLYYNEDIQVIDGNEGSTITGKSINQSHIEVKAQEGAFIELEIKTKHLQVKSSTGGIIKLSGSSKNQEIDLDLYGVYHGYDLIVSDNTTVNAGIGSKAEVKVGETLNVKVSFGGSVFYKGSPEVIENKKVAGGIIKQMN
ncbi:MAG: head GIN domain-containing protein [Flavobacteriaceae bacterium]